MAVPTLVLCALGFALGPRAPHGIRPASRRGELKMVDAAELKAAQDGAFALLQQGFTLTPREVDLPTWSAGGWSGAMQGLAGEPKIGWVTDATHQDSSGRSMGELTAWVAPTYAVPHLVLQHDLRPDGSVLINLDYVPRFDLCADTAYMEQYFVSQAGRLPEVLASVPGAAVAPPPGSVFARTVLSPGAVRFEAPAASLSGDQVRALYADHVQRWLGWWQTAAEVNRMQRGGIFARDSKMHRMRFRAYASDLQKAGVDCGNAELVAQGLVGPGDEQYVGQAS